MWSLHPPHGDEAGTSTTGSWSHKVPRKFTLSFLWDVDAVQGIAASKKQRVQALEAGEADPGEVGLGALSAAVNNLRSILGVVSPIA
jgi:hypothetical protein